MPKRIQRKRIKGWKMPANTIYVGRPSKWGNPFHYRDWDRITVVEMYRNGWQKTPLFLRVAFVKELEGKNLACWCRLDQPCHADVLLEIAN